MKPAERPFSFPKTDRLLKRSQFLSLSQSGKRTQNRHFISVAEPGGACGHRLGITVSKRVGCAVTRNRVKRCIREYFRHHRKTLPGCWDINIIAKHTTAQLPTDAIFRSLSEIFNRIPR